MTKVMALDALRPDFEVWEALAMQKLRPIRLAANLHEVAAHGL